MRFITKYFRPNYTKLQDFDRVISSEVEPALRTWYSISGRNSHASSVLGVTADENPLGAKQLVTAASNYTWLTKLSRDEVNAFVGEWVAKFDAVDREEAFAATLANPTTRARSSAVTGPPPVVRLQPPPPRTIVDAGYRQRVLQETSKRAELFEGLQRIKYRYQEIAANNQKSWFKKTREKFNRFVTSIDDFTHQSGTVGMYLTMYEEIDKTYERATKHGAANDVQEEVIVAGGCYKILKDLVGIGKGVGRVLGGDVLSGAKGIAKSAADLLNVAGGLLYGLGQKLAGHEADYRRLTAQLGAEAYLEEKFKELMGNTMESISEQVSGGPDRLQRAVKLFEAELDKIGKGIRHSQFWLELWKRDLAEIQKDFKANDSSSLSAVLVQALQARGEAARNEDRVKPSEVTELETAVIQKMDARRKELPDTIAKLSKRIEKLEKALVQDIEIVAKYRAAIATRLAIASAQSRSATLGQLGGTNIAYNQHQLIAQEAAVRAALGGLRDGSKEHPAQRPAPTPNVNIADQAALAARTRTLRPAAERQLAPPPAQDSMIDVLRARLLERRTAIQGDDWDDDN